MRTNHLAQWVGARNTAQPRPDWYKIHNLADEDRAEIWLYDVIDDEGTSSAEFISELNHLDVGQLDVRINSPGGNVFDSVAIYNALRSHRAHVTTTVDALAASGASIIAQAGDHRVMLTGSQMMIHEAHGGAIGFARDLRRTADLLDKLTDSIAGIYAERAGGSGKKSHFVSLMRSDHWMDPDEAVAEGLADEVVKPHSKVMEESSRVDVSSRAREDAVDFSAFIESTEDIGALV